MKDNDECCPKCPRKSTLRFYIVTYTCIKIITSIVNAYRNIMEKNIFITRAKFLETEVKNCMNVL